MEHIADEKTRSDLLDSLSQRFGPWVGGQDLVEALGFKNQGSMIRASNRGSLHLQVFRLPGRPGLYVLTTDLVNWILAARHKASINPKASTKGERSPIE